MSEEVNPKYEVVECIYYPSYQQQQGLGYHQQVLPSRSAPRVVLAGTPVNQGDSVVRSPPMTLEQLLSRLLQAFELTGGEVVITSAVPAKEATIQFKKKELCNE